MKNTITIILSALILLSVSCNEEQFLNEKPLDFASPENSFITYNDYKSANYSLYDRTRSFYFDYNALMYLINGYRFMFLW